MRRGAPVIEITHEAHLLRLRCVTDKIDGAQVLLLTVGAHAMFSVVT
jgi:hypothetical protein